MIHQDAAFSTAIADAVERIETTTDAEIVVVAAARSATYRDVTFAAASGVAWLGLVVAIAAPVVLHPWVLVAELVVLWAVTAWLVNRGGLLALLLPSSRAAADVTRAAQVEFVGESVHGTPHRTGVLIYLSALERRIEVVPDLGIRGRIPAPAWNEAVAAFEYQDLAGFLAALDGLGAVLSQHVPALEVDLVDLPNAPRVRP